MDLLKGLRRYGDYKLRKKERKKKIETTGQNIMVCPIT